VHNLLLFLNVLIRIPGRVAFVWGEKGRGPGDVDPGRKVARLVHVVLSDQITDNGLDFSWVLRLLVLELRVGCNLVPVSSHSQVWLLHEVLLPLVVPLLLENIQSLLVTMNKLAKKAIAVVNI